MLRSIPSVRSLLSTRRPLPLPYVAHHPVHHVASTLHVREPRRWNRRNVFGQDDEIGFPYHSTRIPTRAMRGGVIAIGRSHDVPELVLITCSAFALNTL